jgi:long-chain acyl-CoA synthetase
MASVAGVLDEPLRRRPDDEALVDARHRLTYRQLDARVGEIAAGLSQLGLGSGDRLAVSLPNGVDIVVLFLATMRLGAVWVGVHPAMAAPERAWLLDDAEADVVIDASTDLDSLRRPPLDTMPDVDPRAPAVIAYTSGTTGRPKGAVHDQHHLLLPGEVIVHDRMAGRGERVGVHLPLTTANLLVLGPLLAFQGGGTCICTDVANPAALARWVGEEQVEHLSTSPAIVHDLVEHPDVTADDLAPLTRLGVGGASCPEELRSAYERRFGRTFTTGYGLTEAPTAVTQETERVPHVAGASGRPMAHVTIVITDGEGRPLPAGEEGEICVGPATTGAWAGRWRGMHGYWRRPDATAATRWGSLLRTGDIGFVGDDGYLRVLDRRTDLVNRGGANVYPAEVVRVLLEHPAVADAYVFGRPDERLGQEVAAAVTLRPSTAVTADDLRLHCRERLSGYKVPTVVAIVDELPRNAMGKVDRARAVELVG